MLTLKSLLKPVLTALGYDIRKVSHVGLDALNDVKAIYQGQNPPTIFDVGAHLGETAISLAQQFPEAKVYSFEPAPHTFAQLQRSVTGHRNVQVVNAALGNSDGISTLNVNKFAATNSLLRGTGVQEQSVAELMTPVETVSVTVRSLDAYCKESDIGFVDLLKLDVQGFEIEVMRGARSFLSSLQIALIYCEMSFELFYEKQPLFEDVYREITKNGFKLVDLYGHVRTPQQCTRWCDALFVHPEALSKRLLGLPARRR